MRRLGWPQGWFGRVLEKKKAITTTGVKTLDGNVLIIYLSMIQMRQHHKNVFEKLKNTKSSYIPVINLIFL
jgi:ornithine carbamoyltransferase